MFGTRVWTEVRDPDTWCPHFCLHLLSPPLPMCYRLTPGLGYFLVLQLKKGLLSWLLPGVNKSVLLSLSLTRTFWSLKRLSGTFTVHLTLKLLSQRVRGTFYDFNTSLELFTTCNSKGTFSLNKLIHFPWAGENINICMVAFSVLW